MLTIDGVTMNDGWLTLVLSVIGLAAFVILLFSRWYISSADRRRQMRRLMFVDALLVIAGVELVADAVAELITDGDVHHWAVIASFACRGALAAGGIALVATINWEAGSLPADLGGKGGPGGQGGAGGEGAPGKPGEIGELGWGGKGGAGGAGGAGGPPGEKP